MFKQRSKYIKSTIEFLSYTTPTQHLIKFNSTSVDYFKRQSGLERSKTYYLLPLSLIWLGGDSTCKVSTALKHKPTETSYGQQRFYNIL